MRHKRLVAIEFFFVFMIFLALPFAIADSPVATWHGNAFIGTNTSTTGANVSAWINGVVIDSFIVGVDYCGSGCTAPTYIVDVACTQGDSVTLAIYNVTNSTQTCNTGTRTLLNLTIGQLADSAACSWSSACSGGYCCSGATEYAGNGVGACQASACSIPVITVHTPTATTYTSATVEFNLTLVNNASWCGFSLDGAANVTMNSINATSFNYTKTGLSSASYTVKFTCNDSQDEISTSSVSFTVSIPTTTTPSTGGGGGGGGGGAAAESQTKYTGLVNAGGSKEVTYSKEDTLKITSIEITTANKITNAGIKVALSSASAAGYAIGSDKGGAYAYLQITKSLISDDDIASAKIYFKVEKSWYTDNSYDLSTTAMRRKVGDAWQDMPTTKYNEDDTYYYFYADSPGLSYFSVVAYKTTYVPPVTEEAVCGDGVCEYDETCSSCVEDCGCGADAECVDSVCKEKEAVGPVTPEKPAINKTLLILIGAGAIIILAIIIFLLVPKKKKE